MALWALHKRGFQLMTGKIPARLIARWGGALYSRGITRTLVSFKETLDFVSWSSRPTCKHYIQAMRLSGYLTFLFKRISVLQLQSIGSLRTVLPRREFSQWVVLEDLWNIGKNTLGRWESFLCFYLSTWQLIKDKNVTLNDRAVDD